MSKKAPVVVFVYNRVDHASKVLEALSKNYGCKDCDLFIFSDAPKIKNDSGADNNSTDNSRQTASANEKNIVAVNEVRKYIDEFAKTSPFASTTLVKAESNKGLAASIIDGATKILNDYGRIIVVEDDLLTSPDFLNYMNDALDFYEGNPNIWSISGYTFPLKALESYPHDIYMSPRGCSWGWATWKDRFDKVDWNVSDFSEFINDKERTKHFNEGGVDMTDMLTRQVEGKINSWAIRWCYAESCANMFTVYPKNSYIVNIGCDNSGTNCVDSDLYATTMRETDKSIKFENLTPDKKIMSEFRLMYDYSRLGNLRRKLHRTFSL